MAPLEKEFKKIYDTYADAVFRHCFFRSYKKDRARAMDMVQETFLRTWKYLADGGKVDNMKTFLYRVATNLLIDESRKKQSFSLDELQEKGAYVRLTSEEDGPDTATEKRIALEEILEVVDSLDEKYREAITMRYIEDLSIKEIAEILEETENNVSVRLHRGMQKIKAALQKDA